MIWNNIFLVRINNFVIGEMLKGLKIELKGGVNLEDWKVGLNGRMIDLRRRQAIQDV